ncbi:hypothetical protein WMW72_34390 [Paenibacillus filicis]|uniref:Uncharacterized protein n=1 Tax=Paenibacillus filicis TaxID=669464 RepID=A0ABU9DVR6_9BACL
MDKSWLDLTFKFIPIAKGWNTVITDNDTNTKVEVDELNGFAFDFYIRNIRELTIERAKREIKEKLYSGVGA